MNHFKKRAIALSMCAALGLGMFGVSTLAGKAQSSPAEGNESGKPIDVYVLAGQSNMAGTSCGDHLPEKYHKSYDTVKIWLEVGGGNQNDFWKWNTVKFGQGAYIGGHYGNYGFGPELGMAEVLHNEETEIAFIKYAYGGTAIYQHGDLNNNLATGNFNNWHGSWDAATPGKLYTDLFANIRNAVAELEAQGYAPVVRGMAWMQGETDGEIQFNTGIHAAADFYEYNLTQFFNAVREELASPELPIVFGEIYEYSSAVVQAQKIVDAQLRVGELPNNYFIDTGDLVIDGALDDWHWNGLSEWLLGVRFGEKLYEAVHGPLNNAYGQEESI